MLCPLNSNPSAYAILINDSGAAFTPWQLMDCVDNNPAVTQNVKCAPDTFFGSHRGKI